MIDTKTCEVLEDIKIYHGDVNDAFDKTIWAEHPDDYIAKNIRLILKEIL